MILLVSTWLVGYFHGGSYSRSQTQNTRCVALPIFAQRFGPLLTVRVVVSRIEVEGAVAPPGDGGVGEVDLPQDR